MSSQAPNTLWGMAKLRPPKNFIVFLNRMVYEEPKQLLDFIPLVLLVYYTLRRFQATPFSLSMGPRQWFSSRLLSLQFILPSRVRY